MGASKSKCSFDAFNDMCALTLDPAKTWTIEDSECEVTSTKTLNTKKMVFVEEGTTWNSEFKSFLLTLQKDMPQGEGKLAKMFENAKEAGDIVVTHQKKLHQSLKIQRYDTEMFVTLANSVAHMLVSWPGTSKAEASHVAKSAIGGVVASLEQAGGEQGLYSAKEAAVEVYEFFMALATTDDEDMVFQIFEMQMSNKVEAWQAFGLGQQTEEFKLSVERISFVK